MFLLVTPADGKLWRLKYRIDGRERLLAIGIYPEIGLGEARRRCEEARELIALGQFGRFAGGSIAAWSVATEIGHGFAETSLQPDLTLRFNIASGDKSAHDGKLGTFNALFPKGKYFGELSPVGLYNLVNVQPVVATAVSSSVSLSLAAAAYWRQSIGDGVYDIPSHLLRPSNGSTARFIGKEVETAVEWRATSELTLSASLAFFRPGAFRHDSGTGRTIRMTGLEAKFRF
jgi:hypothetical protein